MTRPPVPEGTERKTQQFLAVPSASATMTAQCALSFQSLLSC
jgi:hypothetical protein